MGEELMTRYFWNPETDEVRAARYNALNIMANGPEEMDEFARSLEAWERDRIISHTRVGSFLLSTVFLGIDHSFGRGGSPILFETMVFDEGKPILYDAFALGESMFQDRYHTGREARAAHETLARVSKKLLLSSPQISRKTYQKFLDDWLRV